MNKKIIFIEGILEEIKTRKDKTLKLIVGTKECDAEDAAVLMGLVHTHGYFAFSPNTISEENLKDIPDVVPEFKNDKSKSQRLRNVIYIFWEQTKKGKTSERFDVFYARSMEAMIDRIKEKLEPNN